MKLWNDHRRVRDTCLVAEAHYGLTVTAPADQTAAGHTSRQERERAGAEGERRDSLKPGRCGSPTPAGLLAADVARLRSLIAGRTYLFLSVDDG